MDKEDWRFANAASSGDWVLLSGDSVFDRPASTSWKLMVVVWVVRELDGACLIRQCVLLRILAPKMQKTTLPRRKSSKTTLQ